MEFSYFEAENLKKIDKETTSEDIFRQIKLRKSLNIFIKR